MLRIGLTGGIGSGKSTVAAMLCSLGAGLVDADAISRMATSSGGSAISAIAQHFGPQFISDNGALNRDCMRALVFQNASAKVRLEAIVHPIVQQTMESIATAHARAGKACAVFDIPLLVESAYWRKCLDRILVVDCDPMTQVSRVTMRSAMQATEVRRIMSNQVDRRKRLEAADLVIFNDGISLTELQTITHQMGTRFGL